MGKDNIIIFRVGKKHLQQRRERESGGYHFLDGKRGRDHRGRFGLDCLSGLIENRRTGGKRTIAYPRNPDFAGNPYGMRRLGIPVTSLWEHKPDWTFDGADEIDTEHNMIKGRGGAMFKEKLLISSSPRTYIIADPSKIVTKLGSRFPIPIEIFPEALTYVEEVLRAYNPKEIKLRMAEGKDGPVITENGNLILDAWFDNIPNNLEESIKSITGVIECGLFIHYNVQIIS